MAQEIDLAGYCFIGRTPLRRENYPTSRYYALKRVVLSPRVS